MKCLNTYLIALESGQKVGYTVDVAVLHVPHTHQALPDEAAGHTVSPVKLTHLLQDLMGENEGGKVCHSLLQACTTME